MQSPHGVSGLNLLADERLSCTTRNTMMSTMTVLGPAGEVFLLTHQALRSRVGLPTSARVERIDPISLKTMCTSPALQGGPMWPGGMALHVNGNLHVVYGRYAHQLDRNCQVISKRRLPLNQPYNSFVTLANGLLVTKNLSATDNALLSVLNPDQLDYASEDTQAPEPSIARLSSLGNTVYVVGIRSIFRYHWNGATKKLEFDTNWRHDYIGNTSQTYGWDAVIDGESAWFMDNGKHTYRINMIGRGVNPSANRLIRVSLADARQSQTVEVSGIIGGSITNPPLVDRARRIVVAYDSANRYMRAWRFGAINEDLTPIWEKPDFGCASHMIQYPDTGELVTNDYRRFGEEVVVLDIETGAEKARVRTGGTMQGVVFPSVGWNRDIYWCSMRRVVRVYVDRNGLLAGSLNGNKASNRLAALEMPTM